MQIWAESGKSALPICNYSQILYQFLTFTQNLKRSHSPIICDGEGYPLPITNSSFEIIGISDSTTNNRGQKLYDTFMDAWNQAEPLTEELYNELYECANKRL